MQTVLNNSKVYYTGSIWRSKNCGYFVIIGKSQKQRYNRDGYPVFGYYYCRFNDGTVIEAYYDAIRTGSVFNPNMPSVYGVGYIGIGKYQSTVNGKKTREYILWSNMLSRCYANTYNQNRNISVSDSWRNFQVFCHDICFLDNYELWKAGYRYELDKDYKIYGNTIYGKDTCIFLSKSDNLKEMNQRKNIKKNYEMFLIANN